MTIRYYSVNKLIAFLVVLFAAGSTPEAYHPVAGEIVEEPIPVWLFNAARH